MLAHLGEPATIRSTFGVDLSGLEVGVSPTAVVFATRFIPEC